VNLFKNTRISTLLMGLYGALLFIVAQEFGDDLPAQDYPPRELWLESLVSHPAVVWSELRRRRDQQPVAVIR